MSLGLLGLSAPRSGWPGDDPDEMVASVTTRGPNGFRPIPFRGRMAFRGSNTAMTVAVLPEEDVSLAGLALGSRQLIARPPLKRGPLVPCAVSVSDEVESVVLIEQDHGAGRSANHRLWLERDASRFHMAVVYTNESSSLWQPQLAPISFVLALQPITVVAVGQDAGSSLLLSDGTFMLSVEVVSAGRRDGCEHAPSVEVGTAPEGGTVRHLRVPAPPVPPQGSRELRVSVSATRCRPPAVSISGDALRSGTFDCVANGLGADVRGSWGVFTAGDAVLTWLDRFGAALARTSVGIATPLGVLAIDRELPLPAAAVAISLDLEHEGSVTHIDSAPVVPGA
jgi:hypothetical protein